MTVTQFNRSNLRAINARIAEVLGQVSEEYGVNIQTAGCRYGEQTATLKVEITAAGQDGETQTKEQVMFKEKGFRYGFQSSDFGRTFSSDGKIFTVCGLNPRAKRYPVLARNHQGKVYKFAPIYVKARWVR